MEIGINMDKYNQNSEINFSVPSDFNSSLDFGPKKRKVRSRSQTVGANQPKKEIELKLGSSAFLDKAWKVGFKAAQSNIPENRNPFFLGTCEHELWIEGWWSGFYEK